MTSPAEELEKRDIQKQDSHEIGDKDVIGDGHKGATGENLRVARKAAGLSMKKAAEYSNTPYRSWQDWEGGKRRVPGIAFAWLNLYVRLKQALT